MTNKLTNVLFIVYLVALWWILLMKLGVRFSYMGDRRINLIPISELLVLNELKNSDGLSKLNNNELKKQLFQ